MTANQINYVKALEEIRTHKANEEIGRRQASASEMSAAASYKQAESGAAQAEAALRNAESNVINAQANMTSAGAALTQAQAESAYKAAKTEREREAQEESVRHNKANEANDLIRIERTYQASIYGSDTSRENTLTTSETSQRNTDVFTRGGLVGDLIKGVTSLIGIAAKGG